MIEVAQLLISGAAIGCIYALIALGFVLIYKATEVVNFAQGDLMMLGAFVAFSFSSLMGLGFWAALPLTLIVMALFGAIFDRLLLRPIIGMPGFSAVMVTIAAGFAMRGIASMIPGWGTDTHSFRAPWSEEVLRWGELVVSTDHLAILVLTALLCMLLYAFFKGTRVGIAMQAASQNQLAAYYMGIPVRRINSLIWGIAAGVAGLAAVLLAPITFVHNNMGFIGIKAFPAAVVGGFGSIPGAIVGGLVIGWVEAFAGFYLPEGFKDIAAYVVVLMVLMVKPSGIFGQMRRKKV
ncbi:MAG: branched-chain amino acid ABC transporter permease [Betaproteobacteria bacterium]|nr:branched-chain amino acid ABC transporter permease [Pseudomonadota bacterium]NBO12801.1 branched-chain amino acid ABC transporter permease [Betaproteobacteria bacterium]NBO43063.1 branched-chain amino acid ABC transporter permease [Betaproteobacteria bacterium]NBP09691.1 branched-chain amino acid ABC transporter permease [Betaproteobacteria bacterium]NBP60992.1 branched-chain amino acid ABC transporter permease [Betaproteobacteria bacterium]